MHCTAQVLLLVVTLLADSKMREIPCMRDVTQRKTSNSACALLLSVLALFNYLQLALVLRFAVVHAILCACMCAKVSNVALFCCNKYNFPLCNLCVVLLHCVVCVAYLH